MRLAAVVLLWLTLGPSIARADDDDVCSKKPETAACASRSADAVAGLIGQAIALPFEIAKGLAHPQLGRRNPTLPDGAQAEVDQHGRTHWSLDYRPVSPPDRFRERPIQR
jgi:hypothetical protein